ncbi:helix-turn-helix transcriptional regulator [Amycolatopsis minnesotensis]|uniref:Helix-turn-helix transcriptional regulator n=1 Tax=Amycolatopsis minnesotensis TaxID=337894 RepID=A0ABP5CJ68_9PSEU
MTDQRPTVRARELGEALRAALEKAGVTGKEVARELQWSQSEVSRMLSGKRGVRESDVATLLGYCRIGGAEHKRLLKLCEEANKPGWWQQYGSRLPMQLRTYLDHEDKAIAIHEFAPTVVPGLLQTSDYARAVIACSANMPGNEIDNRVAAKIDRASIFNRSRPARCIFYLHEFVLRLPAGGPAVMSDQLHHLLRMSVRQSISLRVLPADVGVHAGAAGSFVFMEFSEIKPVVYLEAETSALFLEEPEEIRSYRKVLASLAETALPEAQSRDLVSSLATELYLDREDPDEQD